MKNPKERTQLFEEISRYSCRVLNNLRLKVFVLVCVSVCLCLCLCMCIALLYM